MCDHVGGCKPLAKNAIGVVIEEYDEKNGWVAITEPYPTFCGANKAMQSLPPSSAARRLNEALKPFRDPIFEFKVNQAS